MKHRYQVSSVLRKSTRADDILILIARQFPRNNLECNSKSTCRIAHDEKTVLRSSGT